MSVIGNFRPVNRANPLTELVGDIRTLGFTGRLAIVRDPTPANDRAPTHRVYFVPDGAPRIEVGGAWCKKIKRGHRVGEEFLSVTIDDPSFEHPLSFAVFQDDEDTYSAVWQRRQSTAA